jgi:hypothetical protein
MYVKKIVFFAMTVVSLVGAYPFPISFSIPASKIVSEIPEKKRDFATLIPGDLSTYVFNDEAAYYKDYQQSYFAFTWKKGGWDCMRHYEILASGCIPYFVDLQNCPAGTMHLFPKDLVLEAMSLPGVSYGHIDHSIFDYQRYYEILEKLLTYTREHLTTDTLAQYMLDQIGYKGTGKILVLFNYNPMPDYLQECLIIGLKQLYGDRIVDFPKRDYLYANCKSDVKRIYGKGFTYAKNLPDLPIDREGIVERIRQKEFDLVIFPRLHYDLLYHDEVVQNYPPEQIVYACGQDAHRCPYTGLKNFFLREFDSF